MSSFRHEALLYADADDFVRGTAPFIRAGLEAGEPVLVAVSQAKISLLREELGRDAPEVQFADMAQLGSNPARIIPAWRDFVDTRPGAPVRGIGEPIWAERSAAELVECQRHESLLNLAFAERDDFALLCPYDAGALDDAVLEEAHRSHPVVVHDGIQRDSTGYRDVDVVAAPFDAPLPDPPADAEACPFDVRGLQTLRAFVAGRAAAAGLDHVRVEDLLVAVSEVATNSVQYGGGGGELLMWATDREIVCDVRDGGKLHEPLAGRARPGLGQAGGWGLWVVNHLCELVQVRTLQRGTVVRLHMTRA
jgi:anti-sigma regulatory factor (Ser/Thr protein kinase)